MRERYYHPGQKRFQTFYLGDVTDGQTFNRFAYVNGDPVGFIDPLGLAGLGTGQCKKGKARKIVKAADYNGALADDPNIRLIGNHKQLQDLKAKDSHHIFQDAAMKNVKGYNHYQAPTVQLDGPSTKIGSEHYYATQAQRRTIGGGTYGAERRIAYRSLRKAGLSIEDSKTVIRHADEYFMGNLGLTLDSPTRMPGNRKKR